VLDGLAAAHEEKIIHRDLKPDNIFICQMGDRGDLVKILDFGISKVIESEGVSELTVSGTVVGTPHYMAPEQALGQKDMDVRVDVYALGVIMYEALTGIRPHTGGTYNEIIVNILTKPIHVLRSLNPDVPPYIEHVVLKALSRNPDDRYKNSQEMKLALEEALIQSENTSLALPTTATIDVQALQSSGVELISQPPIGVNDKTVGMSSSWPRSKKSIGRSIGQVAIWLVLLSVLGAIAFYFFNTNIFNTNNRQHQLPVATNPASKSPVDDKVAKVNEEQPITVQVPNEHDVAQPPLDPSPVKMTVPTVKSPVKPKTPKKREKQDKPENKSATGRFKTRILTTYGDANLE